MEGLGFFKICSEHETRSVSQSCCRTNFAKFRTTHNISRVHEWKGKRVWQTWTYSAINSLWQKLYSWFSDWKYALNSKQNVVCWFKYWHYSVLSINAEIQSCITQLLTTHFCQTSKASEEIPTTQPFSVKSTGSTSFQVETEPTCLSCILFVPKQLSEWRNGLPVHDHSRLQACQLPSSGTHSANIVTCFKHILRSWPDITKC